MLCSALPDSLKTPDMTALMEIDLDNIALGKLSLSNYMAKQEADITQISTSTIPTIPIPAAYKTSKDQSNIKCPICATGSLIKRKALKGIFWGCSEWKDGCTAIFSDNKNAPVIKKCPECQKGYLVKKNGKDNKHFWGCNAYPVCKFTTQDNKGLPNC